MNTAHTVRRYNNPWIRYQNRLMEKVSDMPIIFLEVKYRPQITVFLLAATYAS